MIRRWHSSVQMLPVLLSLFFSLPVFAADETGFEAVDLAARETINGKHLVIAAYAVIFVFLGIYTWSIARREQQVRRSLSALRRSIGAALADRASKVKSGESCKS